MTVLKTTGKIWTLPGSAQRKESSSSYNLQQGRFYLQIRKILQSDCNKTLHGLLQDNVESSSLEILEISWERALRHSPWH